MKSHLIIILSIFVFSSNTAQNNQKCTCCQNEYRQFDFWLGEWEVFNQKGIKIGENRIVQIQDSCGIQENWTSAAQTGTSYNYYKPSDSSWHQIYLDNQGTILELQGHYQNGTMVLKSKPVQIKLGKYTYQNRISWTQNTDGTVRQKWDIISSNDSILQVAFDGIYKRFPKKQSTVNNPFFSKTEPNVLIDTMNLYDHVRQRKIPIAIYQNKATQNNNIQKVIILSHGYGQNKGGDYLQYDYLTSFLASKGYFVVSVQHELKSDSLLPLNGKPQILRRPFWDRGADNILFVINELKRNYPGLKIDQITLIGHSNGGDMTALFPQKYPNIVDKIITLDNRRMALPRTKHPKIFSLRSSDQPADEGVLPTEKEIKKFGITIIKSHNITHNEMDDSGNNAQRKEIQKYVLMFLRD